MPNSYSAWMDQPVVLQVATGDLRVPLRGVVVGESEGTIRFRVEDIWDIDIYKPMILSVELDSWASMRAEISRNGERQNARHIA